MRRNMLASNRMPAAIAPSTNRQHDIKAPNALLLMLEGRAPWEYAALLAAMPWLRRLPEGDGHPVLVFPGLGAHDFTTLPLRRFLEDRGYVPYPWEQGFNRGPRHGVIDGCRRQLAAIHRRHQRPMSLIGWSLGGVYARELAKEVPERVRCVITLGTPFTGHPRATNAWRLYELMSGQSAEDEAVMDQVRRPPPVPTTSIYSRTDGIVAWPCSINEDAPLAENVALASSHIGLGMNPLAMVVIADRLAQEPGAWKRFDASGRRRWFFRTAT
jgi:pimeloyl-ACP methyl ester carboxylesterase